jgi:hypothetical protein
MIPIPLEMVSLKDVQNEEARYRNLLNLELRYINQNINAILTRAKYVYESVVIHKDEILMNTCCDFKKLEVACVEFIKSHGLQTEQIETDAASVSAAIERNEQERNKRAHPHTKPPRNSHNER